MSIMAVHVLLFILLLRQAPWQPQRRADHRLVVIPLSPESPTKARPLGKTVAGGKPLPEPTPPPEPPPQQTPAPEAPAIPAPPMLLLSKEAFAANDIGKLARRPGVADSGTAAVIGPGDGPGGVHLTDAQWFRKPTNAELATYLPARAPSGFGMVACQTAPRYHVENCRVIDQTPGLGLGQAVRRAAWQFLVVPPRANGQPVIGAWVRIRIDYSRVVVGRGPSLPYPPPPPDEPAE